MNRFQKTFDQGSAFVGYLTAGDGGMDHSFKSILALINGGVNVIEVGMPFSDPVADGPTIQAASERALSQGTTLSDVLTLIKRLREKTDIPIILYSYYNPLLAYGQKFYHDLHHSGADGCLIIDLPPEASANHLSQCSQFQLSPILLISPSTPKERIDYLNSVGKGMLYYVSRKGITGEKSYFPDEFHEKLRLIQSISKLPVVTGVGISTREMAEEALTIANGFVVGSLFVKAAQEHNYENLTVLAKSLDPRNNNDTPIK